MERKEEVPGKLCHWGVGVAARGKSTKKLLELELEGGRESAEEMDGSCSRMLALLSSNGLNMLAGSGNAGFSLKPPPSGMAVPTPASLSSRGTGCGTSAKVSGGAFTGFYRANNMTMRGQDGTLRFATSEETRTIEEGAGTSSSQRFHNIGSGKRIDHMGESDIHNLSREELWRLILKQGSQWPSWKSSVGPQTSVRDGKIKEHTAIPKSVERKDGKIRESLEALQIGQLGPDTLRKLALEELAAPPFKQSGMAWTGVPASQQTATESCSISRTTAVEALPVAKKMTGYSLSHWPESLSALIPKTSDRASERMTASLTIFYAGTVNVCENVPEDKAHLIMLLAERAGKAFPAQIPVQSGSVSAPNLLTDGAKALPQVPTTSPSTPVEVQTEGPQTKISDSDTPSGSAPIQADSSLAQGSAEKSSPTKVQGPAQGSNSNKRPSQGTPTRPLPFCRKTSLARFLDSRSKRQKGHSAGMEGSQSKKPGISHLSGGSKATDDIKDRCNFTMPLCSQSSISMKDDGDGVTSMGEDRRSRLDMKHMNMENQALPVET